MTGSPDFAERLVANPWFADLIKGPAASAVAEPAGQGSDGASACDDMPTPRRRRTRQRVQSSTGERVQTSPARADVLWYPRSGHTTILVRRTHDTELARRLADERWAQLDAKVTGDLPLTRSRVGWWTTRRLPTDEARTTALVANAALDLDSRVITWTLDDTVHSPGPGVEFRP